MFGFRNSMFEEGEKDAKENQKQNCTNSLIQSTRDKNKTPNRVQIKTGVQMQNFKGKKVLLDPYWAKIKTKECLCEILVDDFRKLIQSDPENTRGPLVDV